jgi:peptide-methionine (S)-S-oxide reductase
MSGTIKPRTEVAVFGAGCFWGTEAAFRKEPGVLAAEVGFMGGKVPHPTYRQVLRGDTGHIEVARVTYDPARVSYGKLLAAFFACHDPTEPNARHPKIGTQYRSVLFVQDSAQEKAARAALNALRRSRRYPEPIKTEIRPATTFYRAEEYHQRYREKHGLAKTCAR